MDPATTLSSKDRQREVRCSRETNRKYQFIPDFEPACPSLHRVNLWSIWADEGNYFQQLWRQMPYWELRKTLRQAWQTCEVAKASNGLSIAKNTAATMSDGRDAMSVGVDCCLPTQACPQWRLLRNYGSGNLLRPPIAVLDSVPVIATPSKVGKKKSSSQFLCTVWPLTLHGLRGPKRCAILIEDLQRKCVCVRGHTRRLISHRVDVVVSV